MEHSCAATLEYVHTMNKPKNGSHWDAAYIALSLEVWPRSIDLLCFNAGVLGSEVKESPLAWPIATPMNRSDFGGKNTESK